MDSGFAKYDITQDYAWNYERAPEPVGDAVPGVDGEWLYCGVPVDSPLGIAAGPLLNGKWLLYYASLGFDVLTYKTGGVARGARTGCRILSRLHGRAAWCRRS